jgi:hypothetical protein
LIIIFLIRSDSSIRTVCSTHADAPWPCPCTFQLLKLVGCSIKINSWLTFWRAYCNSQQAKYVFSTLVFQNCLYVKTKVISKNEFVFIQSLQLRHTISFLHKLSEKKKLEKIIIELIFFAKKYLVKKFCGGTIRWMIIGWK